MNMKFIFFSCLCALIMSTQVQAQTFGIAQTSLNEISINISPNPANDNIAITIDSDIEVGLLSVYDINGTLIKTQKVDSGTNYFDSSSLSQGSYVFSVVTDGKVSNFKQVIKR